MRRARLVPALLLAVLLAGCGVQDGLAAAGSPRPTSVVTTSAAGEGPAEDPTTDPDLVVAAALDACPPSGEEPAVPGGLPDVTLPCLGAGPAVRLAGLRGTPTVLNVWASWCEPCRAELPVLAQASERAGTRVKFLGVDQNDVPDAGLALLAAAGVHYPSVSDPEGAARAGLRTVALPVTLFVRPDGTVAHRVDGPLPDRTTLEHLLAEHLGVTL